MKKLLLNRFLLPALAVAVMSIAFASTSYGQAGKKRIAKPRSQSARVEITRMGYEPMSISLRRNVPARITFLRTTESTCATEVVFADYGIRRDLPLNKAVVISFTPTKAGEFGFTCGMNMHRGKLFVR